MLCTLWILCLCQNDYSSFCLLFLPTHLSQLCISDKNGGEEQVRHTHTHTKTQQTNKSTTWKINRDDEQWCKILNKDWNDTENNNYMTKVQNKGGGIMMRKSKICWQGKKRGVMFKKWARTLQSKKEIDWGTNLHEPKWQSISSQNPLKHKQTWLRGHTLLRKLGERVGKTSTLLQYRSKFA